MTALAIFKKYPGLTTLIICQLFLFVVVTYQVKVNPHLTLLEKVVLTIIGPFQQVNAGITGSVSRVFEDQKTIAELEAENIRLSRKLTDTERLRSQFVETELENERLRALLALPEEEEWDLIHASVIGRTHRRNDYMITVDKGSDHGIQADMGVIGPDGVIGVVWEVSARYAKIMTVNNPSSVVAALMQNSRYQESYVRGVGSRHGALENFPNFEPVDPGDLVLTSGLDGIFPKGIHVGNVAGTSHSMDMFREVNILFSTDFSRLENVTVAVPVCEVPFASE